MPFEQGQHFLLVRHLAMVLFLACDVIPDRYEVRLANAEGGVTCLLGEEALLGPSIVNPLGGVGLQLLHRVRQRQDGREREEDMYMVARPVHNHRLALHAADGCRERGKEFGLEFAAETRLPLFGAEDRMNQDAGVSMRHLMSPLLGLAEYYAALSPTAFAVG